MSDLGIPSQLADSTLASTNESLHVDVCEVLAAPLQWLDAECASSSSSALVMGLPLREGKGDETDGSEGVLGVKGGSVLEVVFKGDRAC